MTLKLSTTERSHSRNILHTSISSKSQHEAAEHPVEIAGITPPGFHANSAPLMYVAHLGALLPRRGVM